MKTGCRIETTAECPSSNPTKDSLMTTARLFTNRVDRNRCVRPASLPAAMAPWWTKQRKQRRCCVMHAGDAVGRVNAAASSWRRVQVPWVRAQPLSYRPRHMKAGRSEGNGAGVPQ